MMAGMSTATATATVPTITITDEQIASFRRDGFLRIERITTDAEVAALRVVFDRLFAERRGRESGDQFDLAGADEDGKPAGLPQILGPSRWAPELRDTLYHANGMVVGRALLSEGPGDEVRWGGDHSILKPGRHGKTTPWHQDEAYWDPWHDHRGISIWMPLQAVTVANGCMWFVPGSHQREIVEHQSIGGDPRVHGLEVVDERVAAGGVPVELPVGGCVLHHCRTLHYAGPNTTDTDRHAYIIGYHASARKRAERRHVPWEDAKVTARQQRASEARKAAELAAAAAKATSVG